MNNYSSPYIEEINIDGKAYSQSMGLREAGFIIAQSFGASVEKGSVNKKLAQTVTAVRKALGNIPVLAQTEIASLLPEDIEASSLGEKHDTQSVALSKHSSREILEMALKERDRLGISGTAVLVTHPALIHRMSALWEKAAEEEGAIFIPTKADWSYNDEQIWVRGKWQWTTREIITRTLMTVKDLLPEELANKLPVIKSI